MSCRGVALVVAIVLSLALVLQVRHAVSVSVASRQLEIVERRTAAALAGGRVPQLLVRDNLRKIDRVESILAAEVSVPMARAAQYLISGRPHAALRGYTEALELEERGEVWLNLARAHLELGDRRAAQEAVDRALILDPNLSREALELFASAQGAGDGEEQR